MSEQIPTEKKKILGINQLTEDTSSSRPKDLIFVKSLADNSNISITSSNKPRLSEAENSTLPDHDTDKVPLDESDKNTTDPLVVISDSSITDYDSADKSSACSIPHSPLEKLAGAGPISGPKTIKSNFKVKFTFKAEILKSVIINEPSSALAKVLFCKKCKRTDHKTCDHAKFMSFMKVYQHHTDQGESSSRSRSLRSAIPFPFCIHRGYDDHQSDDCVYYPTCELCGSYDHDTHGHNRIISLRREIKPRNPQHVIKNCKTCGRNVHTTIDHNDIEWFRKREALQAKKTKTLETSKSESSSALRSKTHTKSGRSKKMTYVKDYLHKYEE
nr:hypothetical protein [Tanacetum cinerariifolium]